MKFTIDKEGFGELLRTSPELQAAMLKAAEDGVQAIRPHLPIGTPPDDTHPGRYRESLHAEIGTGPKEDRVGARIVAGAPYAAAIEWGNKNVNAQHPLANAIDLLGKEE